MLDSSGDAYGLLPGVVIESQSSSKHVPSLVLNLCVKHLVKSHNSVILNLGDLVDKNMGDCDPTQELLAISTQLFLLIG